jgi:hypothetical protein
VGRLRRHRQLVDHDLAKPAFLDPDLAGVLQLAEGEVHG